MMCPECDGEGRWFDGSHGSSRHCKNCNGTGKIAPPNPTDRFNARARQAMQDALEKHGLAAETAIQNLADLLRADHPATYNTIRRNVGYIYDLWNALQKHTTILLEEDATDE